MCFGWVVLAWSSRFRYIGAKLVLLNCPSAFGSSASGRLGLAGLALDRDRTCQATVGAEARPSAPEPSDDQRSPQLFAKAEGRVREDLPRRALRIRQEAGGAAQRELRAERLRGVAALQRLAHELEEDSVVAPPREGGREAAESALKALKPR
eukprot:10757608-Alexandrium_andersonii.AAC.1